MIAHALSQFPLPWLMALALALFFVSFAGLSFTAFHRSEKEKQDYLAHLPLGEDR